LGSSTPAGKAVAQETAPALSVQRQMVLVRPTEGPDKRLFEAARGSGSGELLKEYFVVVPEENRRGQENDSEKTDKKSAAEQLKAGDGNLVLANAAARGLRALMSRTRPVGKPRSGKMREVSTILNFTSNFQIVAATDNTTVLNVQMDKSTEWASFAALWDEVIVDGGKLDFTTDVVTTYTSNSGSSRSVVCFDPLDATALGSLSNGMQHQQYLQFVTTTAIYGRVIFADNKGGFWSFRWHTPRGNARSSAGGAIFGHEWSSTGDAGDVYGYLKFFIPQGGATGKWSVDYTWTLFVRFRCRT